MVAQYSGAKLHFFSSFCMFFVEKVVILQRYEEKSSWLWPSEELREYYEKKKNTALPAVFNDISSACLRSDDGTGEVFDRAEDGGFE